MSKAFTDEEASDSSVVGRPVQRAARGHERPMTPEGHTALVEALQQLLNVERPAARARGGLALDAALKELDHRAALLSALLESVRVVEAPQADGQVRFGSTVTLQWSDGRKQEVRLVGPDEVDVKRGHISIESPLARSLVERSVGDDVDVERPRGTEIATILEVR